MPHPPSVAPAPAGGAASWLPKFAVVGALAIAAGFLALRFAERGSSLTARPLPPPPAETTPASPQPATAAQPAAAVTPSNPLGATTTPLPAQPAQTAAEIAASAQQHVLVRLTSTPSGATVTADGKVYGQTPADIEWWGDPAAAGRQITFEFAKEGFEKVTVVRTVHGEKLNVEAVLSQRGASAATAKKRRPREGTETTASDSPKGPVVVPDDFKEDPY